MTGRHRSPGPADPEAADVAAILPNRHEGEGELVSMARLARAWAKEADELRDRATRSDYPGGRHLRAEAELLDRCARELRTLILALAGHGPHLGEEVAGGVPDDLAP
jgi:hypothetical protein